MHPALFPLAVYIQHPAHATFLYIFPDISQLLHTCFSNFCEQVLILCRNVDLLSAIFAH